MANSGFTGIEVLIVVSLHTTVENVIGELLNSLTVIGVSANLQYEQFEGVTVGISVACFKVVTRVLINSCLVGLKCVAGLTLNS